MPFPLLNMNVELGGKNVSGPAFRCIRSSSKVAGNGKEGSSPKFFRRSSYVWAGGAVWLGYANGSADGNIIAERSANGKLCSTNALGEAGKDSCLAETPEERDGVDRLSTAIDGVMS